MPIKDKTRKILWGRSGNRCAICKHELIVNATSLDDESVVGEECHIVSARPEGPRHDSSYPSDRFDAYENLILLCRTHHKMVDDQADTYTVDILLKMKTDHESWVSERLKESSDFKPLRLRRTKEGIPAYLPRLTTGKEIFDLVTGSCGYLMDHDDPKSQQEVELIGDFLQTAKDWGEIRNDLEPSDRVAAAFGLTKLLEKVEQAGFFVFGGHEVQVLEGGVGDSSRWPIAILRVVRKTNNAIIEAKTDNKNDTP